MSNVRAFPTANFIEPDDIDFAHYMRETEASVKVKPASAYIGQALERMRAKGVEKSKVRLPFGYADVEFRPGEVTVWAGVNHSGKSTIQAQTMAYLASVGQKACIASFEMKPYLTVEKMVRQSLGANPSDDAAQRLGLNWNDHLWIYDQQGSVVPEKILAVIRYCAQELGIQHMAVDSLMKCVRGEDDYNGQKDFVNALTVVARDNNIHIHLVHHMRKGDETKRPTRMDLRGSAAIADHVDNVLLIWRNEPKEKLREAGQANQNDPDTLLICDKQRNGEWTGSQKLWYRKDTMQFTDSQHGA